MFSKKATKFDKIFATDLTLCSKCQIDGEDFVNFCGLLGKYKLYKYISKEKFSHQKKMSAYKHLFESQYFHVLNGSGVFANNLARDKEILKLTC